MQSRMLALLVVFGLLALLAGLNWAAFMAPTTIWLGVTSVQAPLGLLLLGVIGLLSAMFLAYVVHVQGGAMLEARRHARDLAKVSEDMAQLTARVDSAQQALLERIDRMDQDFGAALERTEAAMAAYIGELDDRLGGAPAPVAAVEPAPGASSPPALTG